MDENEVIRLNLGHATAYAYYKAGGGTGTEEEFTQWMADLGIQVEYLENMAVVTNTLEPGTPASATYEDGVLTLNIPQGEKGDPAPADEITEATDAWLAENITNPSNPPLDRSLTLANAAAPADMVGDLRSAVDNLDAISTMTIENELSNEGKGRWTSVDGTVTFVPASSGYNYALKAVPVSENDVVQIHFYAATNKAIIFAHDTETSGTYTEVDSISFEERTEYNEIHKIGAGITHILLTKYINSAITPYVNPVVQKVDKTLSAENVPADAKTTGDNLFALSEYADTKINLLHNFIDYGYGNTKNTLAEVPGATDGTQVGVERYKTLIKLSVTNASATKHIKITGALSRRSGNSTYGEWEGTLQLTEGDSCAIKLSKISGTGEYNSEPYLPSIGVYESLTTTNLASKVSETNTEKIYKFTAPSGLINIAVNIATAATLTNMLIDVSLAEWVNEEEEFPVMPYYIDELNDTIQKVRDETTEPALVFAWSTDNHRYSIDTDSNQMLPQNFEYMLENMKYVSERVPLDFVLDTGDLTDGNTAQSTTLRRGYEIIEGVMGIGVPYLFAMGNHDANYFGGHHDRIFTPGQEYKAYFQATKSAAYNANEVGTDYYVDFDSIGVRFIVLNANNVSVPDKIPYVFSLTTAPWLVEALNTDKKVILSVHQSIINSQIPNSFSGTTNAQGVRDAVNAFVNGGGSLIMISGHSHVDLAFVSPYLSVMQDCQRFTDTEGSEVAPGTVEGDAVGYIDYKVKNARAVGTYTEDLWTVCIYKPDSNELSLIRFGSGADRYFHVTPIAEDTEVTTKLSGTITWSTSDDTIATVSDGAITIVGATTGSRCGILAKDENNNYECWVVEVV